jgi:hypothetical protein
LTNALGGVNSIFRNWCGSPKAEVWALVEHSEVLTQDHKGPQLVVHPDAKRARGALRHRRDRGGRVLVELVARDQQNSADDNLDALAVLFLLADLDARPPRHRLADAGKGDRPQFP